MRAPVPADGIWKLELRIIAEHEASAVHYAHVNYLHDHRFKPSQNFVLFDALAGGTMDLNASVYSVSLSYALSSSTTDILSSDRRLTPGIERMGSRFVDQRSQELVRVGNSAFMGHFRCSLPRAFDQTFLAANHPAHLCEF